MCPPSLPSGGKLWHARGMREPSPAPLCPQIGSYFGSEITSVDVDNDGVTDVLLVGAPMYFNEGGEQGKVYVYNLKQVLWEQTLPL